MVIEPERIHSHVRGLCRELERAGYRGWVVGGCLRDLLRDEPAADWDVATSARPDQVLQVFRRVIPTGIQHGTVTVMWKGEAFEVTTLRGEGAYSDGRRPDSVEFVDDIEADLARRDFTVNAMAYDPLTETLVDPFGGLADLRAGLLKAVGDPRERFSEDGLRVLRAARFVAKLECRLDEATEAAIRPTLDTFRQVSAERVRDEWVKALASRQPSLAFEVMKRTGILAEILPSLAELPAAGWAQAMGAVNGEGEPIFRLAGLLHPLAEHNELVATWLNDYRFSNAEQKRVRHLLEQLSEPLPAADDDPALRRDAQRIGREALTEVLDLRLQVAAVRNDTEAVEAARAVRARMATLIGPDTALSTRELAVDGKALMAELGLPPGKQLGQLLAWLLQRVLDEPADNQRDRLLQLAREHLAAD